MMAAFPYIYVLFANFLVSRTRQAAQLDIEVSPLQKIKIYRQKLMPVNLSFRSLAFRVSINFPLC